MPNASLSPISGEFLDPGREAAFQAERLPETVRHARLLFGLSAILNTLFFASDWRFYGDPHFFVAIPARAVVVAISLICWMMVDGARSFRQAQAVCVAWQWINGAAVAVLVSSRSDLALFVVLMLPAIYYLIVPNAFRWAVISGGGCSAMMLAGYLLSGPLPATTPGLVLAQVMLNFALALFVMRSNRLRRLEWTATQAERRAREDLEASLEELQRTQGKLIQSEKLASLGALVAGVAHEVNTPVGIVLTMATHLADTLERFEKRMAVGTLRRKEVEDFLRVQREGVGLVVTNIERAADLIHSFKRVAVDRSSDGRRRFELAGWLNELLFSLSPAWKRSGHRVEVDCPPGIEIDGYPGALSQVLTNLITNAMLHAFPPGRQGTVRIAVSTPDAGTVEIRCEDDGAGIPGDHLERVFDPFFTTRRGAGSTGLGLHIVHNLVTGPLGGTIGVTSAAGRGSAFLITLPRSAPESSLAEPAAAETGR